MPDVPKWQTVAERLADVNANLAALEKERDTLKVQLSLLHHADQLRTDGFTPDFVWMDDLLYHAGELHTGEFDGYMWRDGVMVS